MSNKEDEQDRKEQSNEENERLIQWLVEVEQIKPENDQQSPDNQ